MQLQPWNKDFALIRRSVIFRIWNLMIFHHAGVAYSLCPASSIRQKTRTWPLLKKKSNCFGCYQYLIFIYICVYPQYKNKYKFSSVLISLFFLAEYVQCNIHVKYFVTHPSSVKTLFSCQFYMVPCLFST